MQVTPAIGIRVVACVLDLFGLARGRGSYRSRMEAFESFVALALETEGLVVSEALKFSVTLQTTSGLQSHGYEWTWSALEVIASSWRP